MSGIDYLQIINNGGHHMSNVHHEVVETRADRHGLLCVIEASGFKTEGGHFIIDRYRVRYQNESHFWGKVHKNIRTARYAIATN